MKKTILSYGLLLLSFCLGIIAALLIVSQTKKGPQMSKSAKVAIVDMRTLLSQDPTVLKDDSKVSHEWRDMYNKLQTTMQGPQQELAELQAQLQTKGKELEALQKSGVSSRDMLQKKYQEEIAPLEYKLQTQSQQLQRFVNDEFGKIQGLIFPKVQKAVDTLCKSQGWDLVVNREALISNVSDSSEFNITSDVLADLNRAYASSKKSVAKA